MSRLPLLILGAAVALAALGWQPPGMQDLMVRQVAPPAPAIPVRVVDIGATDETGAPWDRADTARLVRAMAAQGPRVIGHDILYAGDCDSAAAADLALALGEGPQVLGVLLTGGAGPALAPLAGIAREGALPEGLVAAPGAEGPCPELAAKAVALGSASLLAEADGMVREVPMVVVAGEQLLPSLALALASEALGVTPILRGRTLDLGPQRLPLGPGARMLLAPSGDVHARTIPALDVLAGRGDLAGAVVLVGSSLPERGGLRATAAGPLTPSVQVQADLVVALLSGMAPRVPGGAEGLAAGLVLLMGLIAAGAAAGRLSPGRAVALAGLLAVGQGAAAVVLARSTGLILAPLWPALAGAILMALALGLRSVTLIARERGLRHRLAQRLPPALAARLTDGTDRIAGERREVTALFTDLEGFSTYAQGLPPEALIALLDAYFERVCAVAVRQGGTVDKIVGDGLHVLFLQPDDHADRAIDCALALVAETEAFRQGHPSLGRTRIGVESGEVILGDVGGGGRIDHTAHGAAMNLAARLQEINKITGTAICVGPGCAARVRRADLQPLGEVEVRSFGALPLFTPQPGGASPTAA